MKLKVKLNDRGRVADIERDDKSLSWIEKHQQGHGQQLPPLPSYLLPLVNYYTMGQSISKTVQVISISGQQWQALTTGERENLLELVEWLENQTAEDYCRLFQSMFPRDPDFSRRKA